MKKNYIINTAIYSLMLLLFISCSQDPNTEIIYRNTFTVTFHANGGNGEMEDQTFVQDEQQALSKNAFTASQSGRTFGGWATKATGEKVYSDAQFITVTKN
ncbi:MAG: InlB B-repeat-containing protein, partial [Spirochaetales bacterium]|nr:InlB B-repeat-containing protein [Spirochaetales bacterium]